MSRISSVALIFAAGIALSAVADTLPVPAVPAAASESTKALLAEGKILVAVSGEVNRTLFNHVGSIEYANIDDSINKPLTKLADRITAQAGLTDRSKDRYRLDETYAGSPAGYLPPIENVTGGVLSMFHLASIPPGARNIVIIQAYDSDASVHTQQVMALSFADGISLDTLRRAAIEEGVTRVFRIKDIDDIERSRGVYIAGKITDTPFIVTTGTVDTVSNEDIRGRNSGVAENVAPAAGGLAGQSLGGTAGVVATIGTMVLGKIFDSGSATAHIIGYHVAGDTQEHQLAIGSSGNDIKPGDKIRITRGTFLSKVEKM